MGVLVAVDTGAELQLVNGVAARWLVTLLAFQITVFAEQRVGRPLVIRLAERRRDEAFLVVAGATVSSVRTSFELPAMRVFGVAIAAELMGDGLTEIDTAVALTTSQSIMLSGQREVRRRMVEPVRHTPRLPAIRCVAASTILAKRALVRILMAIHTGTEIQTPVDDVGESARSRGVTLDACDLRVPPGQRKAA